MSNIYVKYIGGWEVSEGSASWRPHTVYRRLSLLRTHTNPRFLDSHKTRFSADELDEQVAKEIPAQTATACCWPLPTLASPAGELGWRGGPPIPFIGCWGDNPSFPCRYPLSRPSEGYAKEVGSTSRREYALWSSKSVIQCAKRPK